MMIRAVSPAKINLSLEITGRRDDGYHLIHTVMQAITLYETVEIWKNDQPGIALFITGADLPSDESNTACRAAEQFFKKTGIAEFGLGIKLYKKIPVGAGLAGGSADAAAVLAALNELTGANLPVRRLCEIGAFAGADVPFCVLGGAALCTGTGTTMSPLPPMPDCSIVIAKPETDISTAEAYRLIDSVKNPGRRTGADMEDAFRAGDLEAIAKHLSNDFDAVTDLSGVDAIKRIMRRYGCMGCQMSGSGSAVFGIFKDDAPAQRCSEELRGFYRDVYLCRPDSRGARTE